MIAVTEPATLEHVTCDRLVIGDVIHARDDRDSTWTLVDIEHDDDGRIWLTSQSDHCRSKRFYVAPTTVLVREQHDSTEAA